MPGPGATRFHPGIPRAHRPAPPISWILEPRQERATARCVCRKECAQNDRGQFHRCRAGAGGTEAHWGRREIVWRAVSAERVDPSRATEYYTDLSVSEGPRP